MKFWLTCTIILFLLANHIALTKITLGKSNSLKSNREIQSFRLEQMTKLQQRHTWYPGINERMNDKFSGGKFSPSRKDDKFISYLGFLKDSSYNANKKIMENNLEKFLL
jgi:hypothetical protein